MEETGGRPQAASSLSAGVQESDRGAGGKLRKSSSRRPPATPYSRPQLSRWFSKLVDPARHLITGLPSFFSPAPQQQQPPYGELEADVEEEERDAGGDEDGRSSMKELVTMAEENGGTSGEGDGVRSSSGLDRPDQADPSQPPKVSEIEQLLASRRLSRDEIQQLIGVLHSKLIDTADSTHERLEILDRTVGGTLSSRRQPICDVGNSPVEIARAYMRSRASEVSFGSPSITKDDRALVSSCDLILSPPPLPATRWPGAMVHDQHQEMTPQSERGGFALRSFQRTPYSRSIYLKTKSKLQGESERRLNLTSTSFDQSKAPAFGQVDSPLSAFSGGLGSVGPIRRTGKKAGVDTLRKSPNFSSSIFSPARVENPYASHGLFSGASKNSEAGTSSSLVLPSVESRPRRSDVGVPSHSSQIARKILEHLERNPPTPKDKSAELKLATSWKKPDTSNASINVPNKHSNLHFGNLDSSEKTDHAVEKSNLHLVGFKDASYYKLRAEGATSETHNGSSAPNVNLFGSELKPNKPIDNPIIGNHPPSHLTTLSGAKPGTSRSEHQTNLDVSTTVSISETCPELKQNCDAQIMNKQKEVAKVASLASSSELDCLPKKPPLAGTRPALPAISIGKPDHKWALPSNNSSGFTFPVSASSGGLFEPPTPSIAPLSSASGLYPSIPSYSFGLSRSTPPLVFSFPSTSNSPAQNDATDLKFTFGSDREARISFSPIGKDGVCC